MMLLVSKLTTILGGFLIAGGSFSAVVLQSKDVDTPAVTHYFQAVIDVNTGDFMIPRDEQVPFTMMQNIVAKKISNQDTQMATRYSKQLSPIDGGGIIVNMGEDSFSQMRALKDDQGFIHAQCSLLR